MEKKKGYSMFERDKLDPADSMRIERNIYFEEQTADLSGLTALTNRRERPLPLTKPLSM